MRKKPIRKFPENEVRISTHPDWDTSDIEYWREKFEKHYQELDRPEPKALLTLLITVDATFNVIEWYYNILNVRKGTSSLKKTKKVCEALEEILERKKAAERPIEKTLKRQGLIQQ